MTAREKTFDVIESGLLLQIILDKKREMVRH